MILINKLINCSFDRCGNVYFSLINTKDTVHEIIISSDNSLSCEKYVDNTAFNSDADTDTDTDTDYQIPIATGELVLLADTETLRGKAIKEKEHEKEQLENDYDEDYDYDEYTNDDASELKKTYYYEDKEFNEYVDNKNGIDENADTNNIDNYDGPMFSFNSDRKFIKQNAIEKLITDREEHHALYEVLVYEGSPESSHIIFKTKLLNDTPIYRMCIYTSGDMTFRPIGSPEKKYKLTVLDNFDINISTVI